MRYLFVLIISTVSINLNGQPYNNYINLNSSGDNIGLEIDRYHFALDSVANLLIQALPVSIQNDFKVFTKSFYLQTDDFANTVQDEFDDLDENIENQNEYYLALGRVSDKEREISKYLISFRLPLDSAFVCFNEMKRTIFLVDLDSIASSGIETGKKFASLEMDLMLFMRGKLISIIDYCQSRTFCPTCPTNEEIKKYLGSLGYKPISCTVLDEVPNPLNNNNSRSSNVLGHQNIDVSMYAHEEWNTSTELGYQIDTLNTFGFTAKGLITINEDMCQFNLDAFTDFDSLSNLIDLDPSDIKIRWHIFDNIEVEDDILFERTENMDLFFEELALKTIERAQLAIKLRENDENSVIEFHGYDFDVNHPALRKIDSRKKDIRKKFQWNVSFKVVSRIDVFEDLNLFLNIHIRSKDKFEQVNQIMKIAQESWNAGIINTEKYPINQIGLVHNLGFDEFEDTGKAVYSIDMGSADFSFVKYLFTLLDEANLGIKQIEIAE